MVTQPTTSATPVPATTPSPTTPAPATNSGTCAHGLDPAHAAETIAGSRDRIDDLDDRIIALVQERIAISAEVQRARIATGGPRLSLTREMEILARYQDSLGALGTEVAMNLLELCRGRV